MSILAHANPQLRICEVGSGTGSATSKVLPFLVDSEGLQGDQMVRYVDLGISLLSLSPTPENIPSFRAANQLTHS